MSAMSAVPIRATARRTEWRCGSANMGTIVTITQSQHLFAKMLSSSPSLRRNIFAASGLHTCVLNSMFGVDQYQRPYANFPFDGVVGAIGAFSWRDGMDH